MKLFITRIVLKLDHFRQWLIATFAFGLLNLLKIFPADAGIRAADRLARFVEPKTGRHKLMLYNLARAFPEKSEEERLTIAMDSWGSMGRLAAEYVFLDRLFDFDPENSEPGRIRVEGISTFIELRDNPRPFIVLPPIAAISNCCRWPVLPSVWM